MIVRHIIFAGLFAAASLANAGTVGSTATAQPAWSLNSGLTGAAEPVSAFSSGSGMGGSWSSFSRRGDVSSHSTMVFAQSGPAGSPVAASFFGAAPAAAPQGTPQGAPQAAAANAAAVTFAESAPVPAANIAAPAPSELAAIVVPADVIVTADAPVVLAAVPEPATGMLMLVGLLGAGFMSRRRK